MQQCDKPGGPMHEVIRRTLDELNVHNYYGVITIVSQALAGCERVSNDGRPLPRPSQLGDQRSAVGVGVRAARIVPTDAGAAGTQSANSTSVVGKPVVVARGISAASLSTSTNLNSTTSATASTTQNSNLTTPPKAAIAGPSAGAGGVGTEETRHVFNQTQILRLLLLRAEAFSNTKQHEKALQDAIEAVEVSQRQSAEAYFTVGREQRKLFRIPESVAAFDIAQALLRSIGTASSTQVVSDDGSLAERPSDAEFFAARGFTVDDVRRLGVTRREFEYQESQSRMIGSGEADTPPTSSSATPVAGGSRATFGATPSSTPVMNHLDPMAFSTDKQEISLPSVNSTPRNQPTNVLAVTDGDAADAGDEGADPPQGRCGMSLAELSMWRRLARESRALASMRVSRTVPSSVLETAMTLLDRRVSAVRGALTIAVENCTSRPLRLVGCLAPSAMYIGGFYFPDLVTHSSCGVGLIQPKGWSGYSGVVCYEVDDAVCCMCYFDCPLLSGLKCGVRFVGLRSAALRKAFTLETGCHVPSGGIAQDQAITPPNPPLRSPNCGEEANITVSADTLAAAVKAVKTQPPGAWSTSHTVAIKGKSRTVKVACRMVEGSRSINFTVMEAVPIRLRSVELLTALEYGGAPVLKKLSAVNRRYRQLVNNLPPPLFFSTGAARRAYPDYCIPADLNSSPFTIRDREPVTWKICFESRIVDQEELVVVDETDPSHTILAITCDTQSWVTGTISYGDKRSPLLSIKESWNPFNKSVFVNAASGRTFARCNNTQGVFSFHVGNDTSGKLTEEPHFTVQRRANPAGRDLPKGRLFQGSEIPVATPGAVLPPAPSAPPSHANNLTPLAARAEHYTVWRPHKESGGNLVSSGNPPARTNSGSDIAAELKCYVLANAQTKVKNICLVEMKIFPGADALLVAALAFCIHRW